MLRHWRALGLTGLLGLGCTEANPFLNDDGDTETGTTTAGTDGTASSPSTTVQPTSGSTSASTTATTTATTTTPTGTAVTTDPSDSDTMAVTTDATQGEVSSSGEPVVCPDTHACVPDLVPNNWFGPAVFALTDPDVALDCPTEYPTAAPLLPKVGVTAPDAVCDCDCGDAAGASCLAPVLVEHGSSTTCATAGTPFTIGSSCTDIANQGAGLYWDIDPVATTGGTCTPQPTQELTPLSFTNAVTVCEGDIVDIGGCGEQEACLPVPAPEDAFEQSLCLYRAGDNACPEGEPYTARTVYYQSFPDGRGCSACTCSPATGECAGSIALHNATACNGQGAGTVNTGSCFHAIAGLSVSAARWTASTITAACDPSVSAPVGGVEPGDPVTLCCIPGA